MLVWCAAQVRLRGSRHRRPARPQGQICANHDLGVHRACLCAVCVKNIDLVSPDLFQVTCTAPACVIWAKHIDLVSLDIFQITDYISLPLLFQNTMQPKSEFGMFCYRIPAHLMPWVPTKTRLQSRFCHEEVCTRFNSYNWSFRPPCSGSSGRVPFNPLGCATWLVSGLHAAADRCAGGHVHRL